MFEMTFLKLWNLFFLQCFCFYGYRCQGTNDNVDVRMFLSDNQWTTNTPRSTPITLGSFPYECVGNIDLCPRGFTLDLWYNPDPGDSNVPHRYLLSTGGQSAVSEGIYIRQNYGKEFEIGVASDTVQWTVMFHLVSGFWTNIGLTWSATSGLAVYVDGLPMGEDQVGATRVFWKAQFNPFQDLVIGGVNDDDQGVAGSGKTMRVWRIIHADLKYTPDLMRNFVANVSQSLLVSCSSSPPGFLSSTSSGVHIINDPATQTDLDLCQYQCGASNHFNLVLFQASKQCVCIDLGFYSDWSTRNGNWGSTSCTGTEEYLLEWASHVAWQVEYHLNLSVIVSNPTTKPYLRPNETAIFNLKVTTDEQVTFNVDFKDGQTLVTSDQVVGHAWLNEGTYQVNVTAMTRTTTETVVKEVVVTFVAEGVAPQVLLTKADPNAALASLGKVDVYVSAYSSQVKSCTLAYGDDNTKTYPPSSDFVFDGQEQHSYPVIGFYNVSLQCSNDFGTSAANTMAASVNPVLLYTNVARLDDISIPFIGCCGGDVVQVVADGIGTQNGVSITSKTVGIRDDVIFSASGEHAIQLKSPVSGVTIHQQIYNIIARIAPLTLTSNVHATQIGQNVTFTITVAKGDGLHVNASFGDGITTLLYAPASSTPLTIVQTHSYSTLGKFVCTVTVTNDVSQQVVMETVSIERPIEKAVMYGSNVTSIEESTTFTFDIDLDKSPAMPVSVVFNYDDGSAAVEVILGSQGAVAGRLIHTYHYGKYGIYRVSAIVKNNISSVALPMVFVQVGENITYLDLYVKDSIVAVSQPVVFTVRCPTGSPVVLEMNMGDGSPLVVQNRPVNYSAKNDNKVNQPGGNNLATSGGSQTRQKRETKAGGAGSNDFIVTYQYKSAGSYNVRAKVSNALSNASSSLCPNIIVVSSSLPTPACAQSSIRIMNPASLSNPQITNRSQTLTLATVASMSCSGGGLTFAPGYSWTTERLMSDGSWRPELRVCASNIRSDALTVSGNTLWYGTYRLNVTMLVGALSGSTLSPTLTRSLQPASTYLKVKPTPLVAFIANTNVQAFSFADVVSINMNGSHDPDVDPGNKTGLSLFLFCYTSNTLGTYASLTLAQMLDRATEIGANSDRNVHVYQFSRDPCFVQLGNIQVLDLEANFQASQITLEGPVNFVLFVAKDERVMSTVYQFQVYSTNISADALDGIDEMLRKGNTNAALLVINVVAGSLDGGESDDEGAKQKRTELRGKLINCLDKVSDNLQNIDQLGKTTEVMASVTSNPTEVTDEAKANASNALGRTASKAVDLAQSASSDKVANITASLLSGVGNILPFATEETNETDSNSSSSSSSHSRRRRSLLSALKKKKKMTNETMTLTCCDVLVDLCDWIEAIGCIDERDRKKTNWTEEDCELKHPDDIKEVMARYNRWYDEQVAAANAVKKTITSNGMGACSSIGGVLLSKQGDGADISVTSPKMNITVAKMDPNQERRRRKKRDDGGKESTSADKSTGFEIPSSAGGCGAMSMNSANPFTYSSQGNQVNGNVKTLSLTTCDGNPIAVQDSQEPIVLWMDGAKAEPELLKFSIIAGVTPGGIINHKITVTNNDTAIFAIIRPLDSSHRYAVYLKYEGFPNRTYNDWIGEVPREIGPDDSEEMRFSVYPPQNVTSRNGTYRFGLKLKVGGDDLADADNSSSVNSSYLNYIFTTACRFWNETIDAWDTSGCSVGEQTTALKTQCLCTHLTSFGGSFAVPPNTIDFSTLFTTAKFLESIPVFSTVISLIVVYVLILVWARRMDKADIARWGAIPLEDNLPSDSYYYQLCVYTGVRSKAGTASKPSFVLSGDLSDSGIRHLADGKRKVLPAGSIYNYILSVESNLGPLTFLRIWHDNQGAGKKKGWYLDQIQVTDLQTGERFFFVCGRWLAVEEDDGMIERIIPVAGMNDLTQFKTMFSSSVRKNFSNDHMWFSVFSRPTRSGFTRVQRISCCVALLFLTMITNCMFFKAADPDHSTSIHIGPIELTGQQLYISVVCTCIVLPPSVAIVTIFKKARPKTNAIQQKNQGNGKAKGWRSIDVGSALWTNERRTRMQRFRDAIRNIASFHQKNKYEEEEGGGGQGGGGQATSGAKKKKKPSQFPWWTIYIAYALVMLSIGLSGIFTIFYSMQWGRQKSLDWLSTFFLSFFQSVILVQPIKVLAFAAFLSCILKKPDVEEEGGPELNAIKPDEEYVNNSHLDLQEIVRMRQRSRMETSLPDMEVLKRSRENRLKEMEIEAILKECLTYLVFILVLYFISYQDKDKRSFLFSQNLQTRFFQGDPAFGNIESYSDVYSWLNKTLIPQLYTTGWYNGQLPTTWRELLQIDDHVTIRLGVGRLRQLRIKDNTCKVQGAFRSMITHCRDDYNWVDDDTKSYGVGWTPLEKNNNTFQCAENVDENDPWVYRDALELKGSPYMGKVNSYKGGGYTFNFYRDPEKTLEKLAELESQNWIDVHTRGLLIEFTLYNANVNLYGSVIMLVEFLSNGGPVTMQEVKVFRLTSYVGPFGIIVILFQVIYVGFIIYFLVHIIKLLRKQKLQYFRDFWNLLEFVTMVMSIVTVAMYGMKMIFGNVAMDVLKESGSGKYVNFVTIGVWDETYGFILATVVFLSTIKFINMLKFNRRLSMLTETIKASSKDLKAFIVTFFIYFFAFSQLGYLLFCTQIATYSSFTNTIQVLFCLILGQPGFEDMKTAQAILGPVFYFLYTWFVVFGMQSMFLCIICEAFQVVRKDLQFQKNDYEVVDFVIQKIKGLFGMK